MNPLLVVKGSYGDLALLSAEFPGPEHVAAPEK